MVKPGVSSADQEAGSPRDNRQSTLTTTVVHKPPIIEDCKGQQHILKDQRALLFLRDLAFHNKYYTPSPFCDHEALMKSPLKRVKKVPHIWFSGQRDLYMCPLEVGEGNRTSDVSNHFNCNIVLQVKSDRSSKFASNLHLAACLSQFSCTNTQTQISDIKYLTSRKIWSGMNVQRETKEHVQGMECKFSWSTKKMAA